MLMTPTLNWYVVRVRPQGEFTAEVQLSKDGFHVYVPTATSRRRVMRHARKTFGWQKMPLLPGLIFVAFAGPPDGTTLDDLRSWSSVGEVMGNPADSDEGRGFAKPIPGAVIDRIRRVENEARIVKKGASWQPSQGERVRVVNEDHHLYGIELLVDEIRAGIAKRFKGTPIGGKMPAWVRIIDVESAS
jgi:hypothetical protein